MKIYDFMASEHRKFGIKLSIYSYIIADLQANLLIYSPISLYNRHTSIVYAIYRLQ